MMIASTQKAVERHWKMLCRNRKQIIKTHEMTINKDKWAGVWGRNAERVTPIVILSLPCFAHNKADLMKQGNWKDCRWGWTLARVQVILLDKDSESKLSTIDLCKCFLDMYMTSHLSWHRNSKVLNWDLQQLETSSTSLSCLWAQSIPTSMNILLIDINLHHLPI
jgi:BarA-like signal transduction histidine kinase